MLNFEIIKKIILTPHKNVTLKILTSNSPIEHVVILCISPNLKGWFGLFMNLFWWSGTYDKMMANFKYLFVLF